MPSEIKIEPFVFLIDVDGVPARVVVKPTPDTEAGEDLVIVEAGAHKDALGNTVWTPIPWRDTKRFVAAALIYAGLYGARAGGAHAVGVVERSRVLISPPAASHNLQLAAGGAPSAKGRRKKALPPGKAE